MIQVIQGRLEPTEGVERIKQNTRRFAKRQATWFRNEPGLLVPVWILQKVKFRLNKSSILLP